MKLSEKFICMSEQWNTQSAPISAPCFKRVFSLQKTQDTELTVCGLGFYRIFLNGKEFTKGMFAPYISNTDQIVYYDRYCIDEYLKDGENVLTVFLGNGMQNAIGGEPWLLHEGSWRSAPMLALCVTQNGENVLEADQKFLAKPSPITFDDMRIGESYDARLEDADFFSAENNGGWAVPAIAQTPRGEKRLCTAQPIRAYKEVEPIKIIPYEDGFVYDFGINSAGVVRLQLNAEEGQKISMFHFECFSNGKINRVNINLKALKGQERWQENEYICKRGWNSYTPSFTWAGCRYVFVRGITKKQAKRSLLTYLLVSSELPVQVKFKSSNQKLNQLYANILNSDLSNFYYFPLDCSHREKNGWTGDAMLSAEQFCLNFDCNDSLREWMTNIRTAQTPDGRIPVIVPCGDWAIREALKVNPAWDAVVVEIPYRLYQYYADKQVILENEEMMLRYLKMIETKRQPNGLFCCGMGDREETFLDESSNFNTPIYITDTLVCIDLCNKVEKMLSVVGHEENLGFVCALRDSFLQAFRKNCINEYCKVTPFTQTGQAFALAVGVFEEKYVPYAVQQLVWLVQADCYKIRAGVIGMRHLFNVLSQYGYADIAYKMAISCEYPGFLYYVDKGATSLWESSICLTEEKNSRTRLIGPRLPSLNHQWMGNVSAWLIKYIVGVTLSEDIRTGKGVISPTFVKDLSSLSTEVHMGGECVCVRWKRIGQSVTLWVDKTDGGKFSVDLSSRYEILSQKKIGSITKYRIRIKKNQKPQQIAFPMVEELRRRLP